MKAFIDTSSLFKKYVLETGSDTFDELLKKISEIIVSPIYLLEVNSAIDRRLKEKGLTTQQTKWILSEITKDTDYFTKILWNENLEKTSIALIGKHHLKTLDAIQLASALLSLADLFVTSDKHLAAIARKELKQVRFI